MIGIWKTCLVTLLLVTTSAFGLPKTFIKYRYDSSNTVFDVQYALDANNAESFLVDVASQRTLGTFQQTTVVSTDDFIEAIQKRLAEYEQVSRDLERVANAPLPVLENPDVKVKSLGGIAPPGTPPTPVNDDTSLAKKLDEIESNLKGKNVALGYQNFVSVQQLIQSAPPNSKIGKFSERLDSVQKRYFTSEGVLLGKKLTNLSIAFHATKAADRFAVALINNCIVSIDCDSERFRMLMVPVVLFATAEESIKIRKKLDSMKYEIGPNEDLDAWMSDLAGIARIHELCKSDDVCEESKKFFRSAAKNVYSCSENQVEDLVSIIFPIKEPK